jgi:putative transposase
MVNRGDCSRFAMRSEICAKRIFCFGSEIVKWTPSTPPIGRRLQEMAHYPKIPPRLSRVFTNNPVFFVTFCTHRRRKVLATNFVHLAFVKFAIEACEERNIAVGRYVIMPDHLHLFVCGPDDFMVGKWIGMLKQCLAKAIEREQITDPIWQRGFFDHLLRSDESYDQKWNYVRENPVRAGLVAKAEDWPYAGEIIAIDRA